MKLEKIRNCENRIAADQAQQRLHEAGIESIVQSFASSLFGDFSGLDIFVEEHEAAKARTLLKKFFGDGS
jgi:hypothetical protein